MNEEYVRKARRWVPGPRERKDQVVAELRAHLAEAADASDEDAMTRLGTPRDAARAFGRGEPHPAPLLRRLAAALIDLLPLVAGFVSAWALAGWPETGAAWDAAVELDPAVGFLAVGALAWWVVAVPLIEWRRGRTPGKALFGLRVLSTDGTNPGFWQVVLRRLTLVISGPLQLIDWAFVLFDPKRQRAFDIVAKTIVSTDRVTAVPQPVAEGA